MLKCPMCSSEVYEYVCPKCKYDVRRDFQEYRTLSVIQHEDIQYRNQFIKRQFQASKTETMLTIGQMQKSIKESVQNFVHVLQEIASKEKYYIELVDAGRNRLYAIVVIREITGLGLAETRKLIDSVPCIIKKDLNQQDALKIKQKLELLGAKVLIRK